VGQRHATEATHKGMVAFGNFRLLASGIILDQVSRKAVAVCRDQSGIDQKCVTKFLRKAFADVKENEGKNSDSAKKDISAEQVKK